MLAIDDYILDPSVSRDLSVDNLTHPHQEVKTASREREKKTTQVL